jgi:hypothetical protein
VTFFSVPASAKLLGYYQAPPAIRSATFQHRCG